MLKVENVTKTYKTPGKGQFLALAETSFQLGEGETLALVGDSGSGKSTLGQVITGLIKPSSGRVVYKDVELSYPMQKEYRRDIQILFQHPEVSFNRKLKIISSLKEPYEMYLSNWDKDRIISDIDKLGLKEEHLERYPNELSGGELQRLSLARILVTEPKVLVLDEPTSMLDVMSQAQILHMMKDYQASKGTAFILITHDDLIAEKFADRILRVEPARSLN